MMLQPRLRFWLAEFFGEAKTVTGDVWWYEERQDDGSVRCVPLQPIEPTITRPSPSVNTSGVTGNYHS